MKHEWPIVEEQIGTRQWIFDRVVRHYRAQPRRCATAANRCAYRFGEDRCFVGALIDDDLYDLEMERSSAEPLMSLFAMPSWFRGNIDLIVDLQRIHDTEANWPDGRMNTVLDLFAAERGLRMPQA
jgi:hypothetical protein